MTGSIRLFTPDDLSLDIERTLAPSQAHYLGSVMRRAVGDFVLLFNGRDGEFRAQITALKRDLCRVVPQAQTRQQQPEPGLTLVFAPLKRDTTNLVVEKATELGATRLLPVFTTHTNAGRLNLERCHAIACEAAEQCERLTVPEIAAPVKLFDLLQAWPEHEILHAAIERSGADFPASRRKNAALLVGPEGGFTQVELDVLHRATFVRPIGLGPRILRAETASIAGLALLQAAAVES